MGWETCREGEKTGIMAYAKKTFDMGFEFAYA
jgi:hypothetical protein